MIFVTEIETEKRKAKDYFFSLVEKGKTIEITKKRELKTIRQNRYFHLIVNWFSFQTGYTFDEVKQILIKRHVCPDIFYDGEFDGGLIKTERFRSVAELNTKELSTVIDRFRDYSSLEAGIYLPEPKDLINLNKMKIELNNNGIKI